jgi:PAS domain S-box-containing protein
MGARIQRYDWSASPLGPIETWPQVLRLSLSFMLQSKFPAGIIWGPENILFYNDAYHPLLGNKPEALGRPAHEVWPEAWDIVGPIVESAFGGEASYFEDLLIAMQRKGYPEQTWWTFSYSPIRDEVGKIHGMLAIVHETTGRVLTERRLRFLVKLKGHLRGLYDPNEVRAMAAEMLGHHLGASRVGYGEVDPTGEFLLAERDWTADGIPSFAGRYRLDDFGPHVISELKTGRTVHIDDASTDPRTAATAIAAEFIRTGKRATIIVPLIKDNRFAASLYVHQAEARHWHDAEVTLAEDVAERTWTAVMRAQAEMALRESEERFRQFARHSSAVLWILNLETMRLEYLSPAYETIWGESVEAALDDPGHWAKTLHPDDRARAHSIIERAAQGEDGTHEYHIIRPDGGVRWIRGKFFAIRDEQGLIRRIGGVAEDLTQHEGTMVYVVDGDPASRQDLCLLLQGAGYEVKTFSSPQALLDVAPVLVPGCVVVETRSPASGGLTIPKELKARRVGLPAIVIGDARGNVSVGVQAMKAGAIDFLSVPYSPEQLLDALAAAQANIREQAQRSHEAERATAAIASLSVREREVLDGLLAGGSNKTIARDLDISPRTVEAHRARIMERLGTHSLPELVQIAVAAGLQIKQHS